MSDGSDARMPPRDTRFQQIGVGLHNSFKCGQCQVLKSQYGRKMRRLTKGPLRGLTGWICRDCASICPPAILRPSIASPQGSAGRVGASVGSRTEQGAA